MKKENTKKPAQKFAELLAAAKEKGITGKHAFNFCSGKEYSGKNNVVLNYVAATYFKGCTAFATFKQIEAIGGSVKGQKGVQIIKVITDADNASSETANTETAGEETIKGFRFYTVFNARQIHRRELDQAEADLKAGKIREIPLEYYDPLPLPHAEPLTQAELNTADQIVEVPADQLQLDGDQIESSHSVPAATQPGKIESVEYQRPRLPAEPKPAPKKPAVNPAMMWSGDSVTAGYTVSYSIGK